MQCGVQLRYLELSFQYRKNSTILDYLLLKNKCIARFLKKRPQLVNSHIPSLMVLGDEAVRDRNLFEANFGSSRKSKCVIFTRDITVFSGKNLVPVKEKPMRHAVYFHKGIHAKKLRTRANLIPSPFGILNREALLQLMIRSQCIGVRICARYSAKVATDVKNVVDLEELQELTTSA